MKIFGSDQGPAKEVRAREVKANKNKGKEAAAGSRGSSESKGSGTETVLFSSNAKDIQKVREMARTSPDIRTDKVEELKAKIESGEYYVSGKDIAGKMLKDILTSG